MQMMQAADFIQPAKQSGFNTWAGVPCSFLTPFINTVISDPEMDYISSANEGDAVATVTGAALAGRRGVAMMQNSGLGNAVSPLSSLNWVFRIPILLIITLRGEPGLTDEPQHELMGRITTRVLDDLQIPWDWFPRDAADVEGALTVATWQMDKTGLPYALIMRKGSVAASELENQWRAKPRATESSQVDPGIEQPGLTRREALHSVIEHTPVEDSIVIGTTGYTGRELYCIEDRPNHLYMVGSMGCASSLALGLSMALPEKRILVADGDGAALMRMGNLATIGAYAGENFGHLLLDNNIHESTGGQATVSSAINFAGIARSCGYRAATQATGKTGLEAFLQDFDGPSFMQLRIRPGVPDDLPRPDIGPVEVKNRLMNHLGLDVPWADV
jgi:phosphonopyruvate decarboxylase